jgi:hypothetical protein
MKDSDLDLIRSSLNNAIHELVFAVQHADQGDLEDATNCLMTAQGTIDQVAELLVDNGG